MEERYSLKENRIHGNRSFPFCVYYNTREQEDLLSFHWHEEAEFIYVKNGAATFYIDTVPLTLQSGEAAFVQNGRIHGGYYQNTGRCEYYSIVFRFGMLLNEEIGSSFEKYIVPLCDGRLSLPARYERSDQAVIREIRSMITSFEQHHSGFEMAVIASLYKIISEMVAENKLVQVKMNENYAEQQYIERFKTVLDFIHSNFNQKISVEDMARSINISPYYFCRFFKRLSGKTPFEYLNHYRINQAAAKLLKSEEKITDIAYETGFSNFSYFIKLFKEDKGFTPSEFRKQNR